MATLLAVLGLILNFGGIGVTLWGLDELSSELFPGRPLPHRATWQWIKWKLGRKRVHRVVIGSTVGATASVGHARGQLTRTRPADDAPLAEWNLYWESRVDNLDERLGDLQRDTKAADDLLERRVAGEEAARVSADTELAENLRMIIGGKEGSGLVKAWWGLFATALGTLLQGIAPIFG
ncbi:MAG: hypothetical protein LC749_00910 [Actinobacteria bacterium]|nr:hypothetical protein [Actinomycetota bacterium]